MLALSESAWDIGQLVLTGLALEIESERFLTLPGNVRVGGGAILFVVEDDGDEVILEYAGDFFTLPGDVVADGLRAGAFNVVEEEP